MVSSQNKIKPQKLGERQYLAGLAVLMLVTVVVSVVSSLVVRRAFEHYNKTVRVAETASELRLVAHLLSTRLPDYDKPSAVGLEATVEEVHHLLATGWQQVSTLKQLDDGEIRSRAVVVQALLDRHRGQVDKLVRHRQLQAGYQQEFDSLVSGDLKVVRHQVRDAVSEAGNAGTLALVERAAYLEKEYLWQYRDQRHLEMWQAGIDNVVQAVGDSESLAGIAEGLTDYSGYANQAADLIQSLQDEAAHMDYHLQVADSLTTELDVLTGTISDITTERGQRVRGYVDRVIYSTVGFSVLILPILLLLAFIVWREMGRVGSERRRSEQRYQSLVENTGDLVYTLDPAGVVKFINGQVAEYGYERDEVIGRPFTDFIDPRDQEKLTDTFVELVSQGGSAPLVQFRFIHKDGSPMWAEALSRAIVDEQGQIISLVGAARDIHRYRQVSEQLEQERARLLMFFHESPEAMLTFDTGARKIVDCNQALVNLFGYGEPKELIGQSVEMISVSPVETGGISAKIDEVVATVVQRGALVLEWPFRAAGGHEFTGQVVLTPMERDGQVMLQAVIKDVSAEQAEVHRALQLALIVEGSTEGIMETDTKGIIQYVNPAWEQMTGWTAAEVVGKVTPRILKSDEHGDDLYRDVWRQIAEGKHYRGRFVNKRKNGHLYVSDQNITCLRDADGQVIGYIGFQRDVTEQEKVQTRLQEMDQLRSRFVAALAHVTRVPLDKIRWSLESLMTEAASGELEPDQQLYVQQAMDAESEIMRVINNMNLTLDIERDALRPQRTPASLASIVESIVKSYETSFSVEGIDFQIENTRGQVPAVDVDVAMIRRVLAEMISNCLRYVVDGRERTVRIRLSLVGNKIRCEVKDNGIGIPETEQPYVFGRFYRASNAVAAYPSGLGLGMYVSKRVIELHDGSMGFDSQEGEGATFWFELPIYGKPHPILPSG